MFTGTCFVISADILRICCLRCGQIYADFTKHVCRNKGPNPQIVRCSLVPRTQRAFGVFRSWCAFVELGGSAPVSFGVFSALPTMCMPSLETIACGMARKPAAAMSMGTHIAGVSATGRAVRCGEECEAVSLSKLSGGGRAVHLAHGWAGACPLSIVPRVRALCHRVGPSWWICWTLSMVLRPSSTSLCLACRSTR